MEKLKEGTRARRTLVRRDGKKREMRIDSGECDEKSDG